MSGQVHALRGFYATPAGLVAARLLRARLAALWPSARGEAVLGLGYASPFLRQWRAEAARCVALVPDPLPRWRWPRGGPGATAVAEGDALPFPDLCFDRVLLVHGLETAENARRLLREAWRVLKDDGRLLAVVPNRLGLWALRERTPFGHGEPYTAAQLESVLQRAMFAPERREAALFVPPFLARPLLHGAAAWERAGRTLWPRFAGVVLVEARKEMFGGVPAGTARARRRVVMQHG